MSILRPLRRGLILLGSLFYREHRDGYIHDVEAKVARAERIATGNFMADALNGVTDDERRERP